MNTARSRSLPLLRLARLAWLVVTVLLTASFVASIPTYARAEAATPHSIVIQDSARLPALLAQVRLSPAQFAAYRTAWQATSGTLYLLIGLLLYARRPSDWRALGMATLFVLVGTQGGSFGPVPGNPTTVAEALALAVVVMANMGGPLLMLLFPDGRFVPRWGRWLALATLPFIALNTFFPNTPRDLFTYPALGWIYGPMAVATFVVAPTYRYLRVADATQRQQLKWALLGLLGTPLAWLINGLLLAVVFPAARYPESTRLRLELAYYAWSTPLYLAGPVGIGLAVMRHRLWDIDVIIRRTLTYSLLSALLAIAYLGSVLVLQGTFGALTGDAQSPLVTVLSTLVIAALFFPLRARVQALIDRRFYRRKYDAARTLVAFVATARDETDLERLVDELAGVVHDTMQPERVGLWLKAASPGREQRPP